MADDHEDTQPLEIDIETEQPESIVVDESETLVANKQKKKDGAAASATREREAGKSILPFSRVQKIIKVDKVRINGHRFGETQQRVGVGSSNGCTRRDYPDLTRYGGVHQKADRSKSKGR